MHPGLRSASKCRIHWDRRTEDTADPTQCLLRSVYVVPTKAATFTALRLKLRSSPHHGGRAVDPGPSRGQRVGEKGLSTKCCPVPAPGDWSSLAWHCGPSSSCSPTPSPLPFLYFFLLCPYFLSFFFFNCKTITYSSRRKTKIQQ